MGAENIQAVTYSHIADVLLQPPEGGNDREHEELVALLAKEEKANSFSRRTVFLLISRLLEQKNQLSKALENQSPT